MHVTHLKLDLLIWSFVVSVLSRVIHIYRGKQQSSRTRRLDQLLHDCVDTANYSTHKAAKLRA